MDLAIVEIAVSLTFIVALLVSVWRGQSDRSLFFFASVGLVFELILMGSAYTRDGIGTDLVLRGLLAVYFAYVAGRAFLRWRHQPTTQ